MLHQGIVKRTAPHRQLQIWDSQEYNDCIGATALIQAKAPTVLPFIAFVSPLQMSAVWHRQITSSCYYFFSLFFLLIFIIVAPSCYYEIDNTDLMKLCCVSPRVHRPYFENCCYTVSSSFVLVENYSWERREFYAGNISQMFFQTLMHLHQGTFLLPHSLLIL